ncbi:hypothetical protein CEP52_002673 [Fusarium oligoseptatum]|uniref:BZIP domain-containing protein n=1 Tax=Fusarium oligoseptatum TaxID=2604345 RepID=A0A428UDA9_9HYPO|nr:hypothetical protein CEP52_002673 [Fusarium oligoseptatum]
MPKASSSADASTDASTVSQKRLRNRLSQQAFRKRQSAYIKDLERRLEIRGGDEDGRIARLERDNQALRAQLTAAIGKLERVQMTLRSLSNSMMSQVSHGKETDPRPESSLDDDDEPTKVSESAAQGQPSTDASPGHDNNETSILEPRQVDDFLPLVPPDSLPTDDDDDMGPGDNHNSIVVSSGQEPYADLDMSLFVEGCSPVRSLPGVWAHHYQMGPACFQARRPSTGMTTTLALASTNSSFSDHMQMIRACLVKKWTKLRSTPDGLRLSVTVMLSLFHSLSRPAALAWYTATKFQDNVADLLLWQMDRSRVIYSRLHASYRPSALQLLEDYPSVIDWCPFPTIRDKLILLHSANPCLDQIICDIATAYVVEVDAGRLLLGHSGQGYIRVWDLVCALEADDDNTNPCDSIDPQLPFFLPAPSIEDLFEAQCAREAFKVLGLDDGVPRFKIDPSFFIQYPELYDPGADIIAAGAPIAPKVQTTIPLPTLPRQETVGIYQNVADWCVSAISKASLTQIGS